MTRDEKIAYLRGYIRAMAESHAEEFERNVADVERELMDFEKYRVDLPEYKRKE